MDLGDYNYGNRPYTTAKIFDVHALSNDGFRQYIGPDSYAHKYLSKITPKLLKTIYNSSEKNNHNKSSNLSKFNFQDQIKEENIETLANNDIPTSVKYEKRPFEEEKQAEEHYEKEKEDFGYKTSNAFFNNLRRTKNKSKDQNSFNKTFMNKSGGNFHPLKSNLDLLSRRLNYTSSNFNRTDNSNNNFQRFDNNYLANINVITKKEFFKNKNDSEHKYTRRFDGFQSYNVPRVEKEKIDASKPMNKLAQSIAKSCVGNKRVSYISAHSSHKLKEVAEENKKLTSIIQRQMNKRFLKSTSLPDITDVVSQPKLKIKKLTHSDRIKHMGGRYNPYNFQAGRDCENMRRNHVGGLFQH